MSDAILRALAMPLDERKRFCRRRQRWPY